MPPRLTVASSAPANRTQRSHSVRLSGTRQSVSASTAASERQVDEERPAPGRVLRPAIRRAPVRVAAVIDVKPDQVPIARPRSRSAKD